MQQFATWGLGLMEKIEREYRIGNTNLYAEQPNGKSPSFMWTGGVLLSAYVSAARHDKRRWEKPLDNVIRGLERYWNPTGPVAGYDVLPVPKQVDRYYDDNAWVVIALLEAADVTGRGEYEELAQRAYAYVYSGEDPKLGGGIYWRESDRATKNTCSNGPSAFASVRMMERMAMEPTKRRNVGKHQADAQRIYDWTLGNLQDKDDGLFWDNMNLKGEIEKTKWSYNTALMLRTACGLTRLCTDVDYANQTIFMAEAAAKRWLRASTGAFAEGAQFAHLLSEALLDYGRLSGQPRFKQAVTRGLMFLHDRGRDSHGYYTAQWDKPVTGPIEKPHLRDQASAARAFLVLAEQDERSLSPLDRRWHRWFAGHTNEPLPSLR